MEHSAPLGKKLLLSYNQAPCLVTTFIKVKTETE